MKDLKCLMRPVIVLEAMFWLPIMYLWFFIYSIVFSHTSKMMLVFVLVLSGGQPGSALANVVQIYGQGEYILRSYPFRFFI